MKKSLAALLAVLLIFGCAALTACSKKRLSTEAGDSQIISADEIADTMTSKDGKYEIAMVTNVGRLKDKSFNREPGTESSSLPIKTASRINIISPETATKLRMTTDTMRLSRQ